ncbi:MAG TPA: 50S ribosomal protein L17 [Gemmataceae bacterium]|nr:50S ribosomal protein L17 [Gemmataceae bacterium]
MRHLKAGRKLGRNASHRLALMRNLAAALIERERIITTVEKAKEARRFVEKLITLAKKETLHARRRALAKLGPAAGAQILDKEGEPTGMTILKKLFSELGPRFADRPGGYTRIIKRHERRLGDAGRTAIFELLKAGETKVRTKAPPPAPRVEEKPRAEEPAPDSTATAEPPPERSEA